MPDLTRILGFVLAAAVLGTLPSPEAAQTELHWRHGNTSPVADRVAEIARKFNDSQPDYEVKLVYKGSYPDVLAALIAAYRSNTQPHMALIFEAGTQTMLASGSVMPVYK